MAILSFIFEQLFMLLVPEFVLLVSVVGAVRFPREPDFAENVLSIKSNFVIPMKGPLRANPDP
jgi:hypothetical protein